MATRRELYEQMIRDRADEAVDADRANRRTSLLTVAACLFWCVLGGAVMFCGLTSSNVSTGHIALQAGAELATAGSIFTLLYAYRQAEKRGDR